MTVRILTCLFLTTISSFSLADTGTTATQTLPKDTLTPFVADYKSHYKLGWFGVSISGERKLVHLEGNRWRMTFNAEASVATLKESSEFLLLNGKILPLNYTYRTTGLITEDDRTLSFNHDKKEVFDYEKKRVVEGEWADGIQDNLTYMLQAGLDLSHGKTELTYPVFERRRVKIKEFKVLEEELLKTDIGELQTLKIEQLREEKNRKIYAWLAVDHQYQLVRLTDQENGKITYRINITRMKNP